MIPIKALILIMMLYSLNASAENMLTPEWKYPSDQGWYPNPRNCPSETDQRVWRQAYEACYKQAFIQSEIKTNYQGQQSQYLFRDLYEQCMGSKGHFVVDTDASRVQYGEHYTTRRQK